MAWIAWLFLASSLLYLPSQALRTLTGDSAASQGSPAPTGPKHSTLEMDGRHLPKLDLYDKLWRSMYSLEARLQEPMDPAVQLVLGVMTVAGSMDSHREVIRATWLQQRGVCLWSPEPQANCSVYVAFVMGRAKAECNETVPAYREPGALLLDVEESMNEGKSPMWMAAAARMFPWATHYGKIDMDTYPFLHKLVGRMAQNRSCVNNASEYEWIGRPAVGRMRRLGTFKRACADRPCLGWFHHPRLDAVRPEQPFRFMQGEMYIMSRPLVQGIEWWPRAGSEDVEMGKFVANFSRSTGRCVAVRKLDASAHLPSGAWWWMMDREGLVDSAFANDLEAGYAPRA